MRSPLLAVLALVLAFAASGCRKEAPPGSPPPVAAAWRGDGGTIEVTAWKLTCPGCAASIRKEIEKVEGVRGVDVDVETSRVTVTIADPARRDQTIPKIREAVHAAGKKVLGEDPS